VPRDEQKALQRTRIAWALSFRLEALVGAACTYEAPKPHAGARGELRPTKEGSQMDRGETQLDARPEKDTVARNIGRYVLFREVAHGGMATVHLGRLRGVGGFARTVAIKRLHPQFARDPEFVSMFLDEARLAARIQHPNVVSVLDVVAWERELFLVMDYVHGEGLSKLLRRARLCGTPAPASIVCAILIDLLYGLHAAHEALSERGDPLNIVHRDVSPQNVLVGVDGVARVLDFGIAKAAQRYHQSTQNGRLKGKLGYMAPEQLATGVVDRRLDVYAAAVVLWEALAGERFFPRLELGQLIAQIMTREHRPPSERNAEVPPGLDAIVLRGLARQPEDRYATAHDMAADLERVVPKAPPRVVGEWVMQIAGQALRCRAASISKIEMATLADAFPRRTISLSSIRAASAAPVADPFNAEPDTPSSVEVSVDIDDESDDSNLLTREVGEAIDWEHDALDALRSGPHAPRARVWWLLAGAAALVGGGILAVRLPRGRSSATERAATAFAATAQEAPTAPSQPADVPPTPTTTTAAAPESALPPAPPPATASTAGQVSRPPAANVSRLPASRNDCTPPYVVDPSGVRIPKRWCT
jgi:serine/threonine-protein kinase